MLHEDGVWQKGQAGAARQSEKHLGLFPFWVCCERTKGGRGVGSTYGSQASAPTRASQPASGFTGHRPSLTSNLWADTMPSASVPAGAV